MVPAEAVALAICSKNGYSRDLELDTKLLQESLKDWEAGEPDDEPEDDGQPGPEDDEPEE